MEPNKIDKQFREKLNAREIQPSAQAWDRLDAMLSVSEEKKTRKPFGFLFIAASILVFVTLGLFLFNQNGTEINTINTVVGTETKIDTTQNKSNDIQAPIVEIQKQNEAIATSEVQPANKNRQLPTNNQGVSINNQSTNNQNQIIKDKPIEFQYSSDVAQKSLPKVMEPKEIVIRKPISVKSDESLLADLDKSAKEKASQKSTLKVDPKSLLSQVDGEVEYSFRERVFNKVNKNYKEIKVALANRNTEE
ncbi:hypothetical protein IVB69_03775 [Flavobacterium sp. J49]|uniref:hypothetical protein n=1 Tax=Flavobacterium sp. J49 TaxID=2718534 RepID=UPI001594DC75|nr:hypothetical protein [Flavobacterium sp. J49]MBF6640589.1 hypothetical protein [Flavobacterium sp. J49]NIC01836.1 hypothetical protein [Flavobacterium sp. J49]